MSYPPVVTMVAAREEEGHVYLLCQTPDERDLEVMIDGPHLLRVASLVLLAILEGDQREQARTLCRALFGSR